jgi:hypothetical protein
MTADHAETAIRGSIGGDPGAIAWIAEHGPASDDPVVVTVAALLARAPDELDRAGRLATTSRDRQLVSIARAHLAGDADLVDALARDHLVDHPDSIVVAWIAAGVDDNGP